MLLTNNFYICFYVYVLYFFYSITCEWNSLDECGVYNSYYQISIKNYLELDGRNNISPHCLKRCEGLFSLRLIFSIFIVLCINIDFSKTHKLVMWCTISFLILGLSYFVIYEVSESFSCRALSGIDSHGGGPFPYTMLGIIMEINNYKE